MARYSVPSITFKEIDNTIRNNSEASLGVGAIVMKANRGPVNQRVLTTNYNEFTKIFGEPENLDDYGHFAAQNFLQNSTQLLAIRSTMGDEGYAQIQFPYTDAAPEDKFRSDDTCQFSYINNTMDQQLKLTSKLGNIVEIEKVIGASDFNWQDPNAEDPKLSAFILNQTAQFGTINDLISDETTAVAVFKSVGKITEHDDVEGITTSSGKYIKFASNVTNNGEIVKYFDDLILTNSAFDENFVYTSAMDISRTVMKYEDDEVSASGRKVQFVIPANDTLNHEDYAITAFFDETAISGWETAGSATYQEIFDDEAFYKGKFKDTVYCEDPIDASRIEYIDWDDCAKKIHYVDTSAFKDSVAQSVGLSYREFGQADYMEDLAIYRENITDRFNPTLEPMSKLDPKEIERLAEEYGTESSVILSEKYAKLTYHRVWNGFSNKDDGYQDLLEPIEKIVYLDEKQMKKEGIEPCKNLFWMFAEKNKDEASTISVYTASNPELVTVPWQESTMDHEKGIEPINKMVSIPTSEVLNSVDGRYDDGYTLSTVSEEEPGNGDIENYVSNKENQLIIASIGPGKYGNDVGVSIITTAAAEIPALNNHPNAFSWKYRYDDEDQVNEDDPLKDLTWKKVYRINVYVKTKTETAEAAWGTGLDALVREPIESWFVSNDPTAKDGEGNSLYAPTVINGHSEYIYVSRSSVADARTGAGNYAQPVQTYAIYGLTGGSNSTKNNMSEKTAALKLYTDRQKANFDILFNVDAIDTFNGRQRYNAHQRRIAEIAAARTMDIGVIQVTSKEDRNIRRMLSDAKMFSFNKGTYVACYAGYDRYYNDTLASWIYLPKSVAGACAMAYCDNYAYPWMAPAGVARGGIAYTSSQLTKLTDDEIGKLYDINVNTSRMCGGYGEVLWGQKTALKKESALNRINVRRCLNFIEKQLENMMTPYLFQQNTANTRASARNTIESFLSRVQAAEGIISYSVIVKMDDEDPHIMEVGIKIIPAECIEYIPVTITIDRNSGVIATEG